MNKEQKLEQIYKVVWVNDYIWELWNEIDVIMIWDCLDWIEENNITQFEWYEVDMRLIYLWKNKRLPIDQEEEAIELMYNLIPKE
jgi:hypothetical protein